MIKKLLIAIMIALPMCVVAQAPKFGIVNVNTVFEAMPDRVDAQTALETASKTYEDEFKKLTDELEKKYTEFQSLAADTPETIKQRRIQEIQEFEQKIQQFRATAQQELQRQQEQLMAPIQQKIQTAIQAVGTENGFTFIFPDAIPSFVGADVQDVTPLVKTKLGIQ
ncbi:MAG: OmpH family outer membrane protein [Muribaculaceae bacterium]|nr:OmpH family outer membrane protein [Muribaculaceae bacterium]